MARNGSRYRYLLYRRRRRNGNGRPRWLTVLMLLGAAAIVGTILVAGVGFASYQTCVSDIVEPDEAISRLPRSGARIFDRNGTLLFQYLNPEYGLLDPVPLNE